MNWAMLGEHLVDRSCFHVELFAWITFESPGMNCPSSRLEEQLLFLFLRHSRKAKRNGVNNQIWFWRRFRNLKIFNKKIFRKKTFKVFKNELLVPMTKRSPIIKSINFQMLKDKWTVQIRRCTLRFMNKFRANYKNLLANPKIAETIWYPH